MGFKSALSCRPRKPDGHVVVTSMQYRTFCSVCFVWFEICGKIVCCLQQEVFCADVTGVVLRTDICRCVRRKAVKRSVGWWVPIGWAQLCCTHVVEVWLSWLPRGQPRRRKGWESTPRPCRFTRYPLYTMQMAGGSPTRGLSGHIVWPSHYRLRTGSLWNTCQHCLVLWKLRTA